MNQDPLISGGIVKAALIILLAGGIGVGAYALAGSDIGLPDIDLEELSEQTTTNLTDTDLSDTTIDVQPEDPVPTDTFTTASFAATLDKVREVAGGGRSVTRVAVNEVQTQFFALTQGGAEAFSVRADTGEVVRESATIEITGGNATIEDFAFKLDAIDPAAVDRMLTKAAALSGAADFKPTVLSLERRIPFGDRALAWTINAQAGGKNLLFRADEAGRQVSQEGTGTQIPPGVEKAQALGECIEAAGEDTEEIFACLEEAQP